MKLFKIATLLAAVGGPALGAGYSEHKGVRLFTEYPCDTAIQAIESEVDIEDQIDVLGISAAMDEIALHIARQGMAWGFVLGYDTAQGGLERGGETTLERFKAECSKDPELTGIEVLETIQ